MKIGNAGGGASAPGGAAWRAGVRWDREEVDRPRRCQYQVDCGATARWTFEVKISKGEWAPVIRCCDECWEKFEESWRKKWQRG